MRKGKDQIKAFLGKDTEFNGRLVFSGAIRIDGKFKGEILTDGTLIIGETANLEAEIRASHVIISGHVKGDMSAKNKIEIHSPGRVYGNIQAPIITIADGVLFEGNCHMNKNNSKDGNKERQDSKLAVLPK